MGENIIIPIENVEAFSADLGEIAEELEQRRSNVAEILSELYGTWSGTGKGAFQESAASQDARFGRILQSFQYAQRVFANTVIPGLHSLQLTASRLGAAFDVGGESDGGTLKLSESSNLSSEKTAIQEAALDAALYFTAALNSLSLVSSTAVSSEGILAIKKTTEENAKRFEIFTSVFQDYKNSVRLFCRGLRESFGVLSDTDEYRDILVNADPSTLGPAGQQLWGEAMYQICMQDDSVWKNILGKSADEICPAEYALLASVYASLDQDKLDDFLTECMYGITCLDPNDCEYPAWKVDSRKIENITQYSAILYAAGLEQLRNNLLNHSNPDDCELLQNAVQQILQRNVLLSEIANVDVIAASYNSSDRYRFNITSDDKNNLIVNYYKTHIYSGEAYDLPEKITINAVASGQNIKYDSAERLEIAASSRFGFAQTGVSTFDDDIRGKLTDKALDVLENAAVKGLNLTGKAAKFVPVVGELISLGADLGFAAIDSKEDVAFIHAQVNKMRAEFFYGDFDCNAVFVTRDTYTPWKCRSEQVFALYVEEGVDTRVRIDNFNDNFPDSQISISDLLDPGAYTSEALDKENSIFKILKNAQEQNGSIYNNEIATYDIEQVNQP